MKKLFLTTLLFILAASAALAGLQTELEKLAATSEGKVSISLIDLKGSREAAVNGDLALPAASVAKVPVMCAAFNLADRGLLDLQRRVLFRESDKLEGAGVLRWMKAGKNGQEYSLWNLIRLMITLSDNTATRLVVNAVGLPTIEAYVRGIGLKQTRIIDPTMLVEPPAANNNLTSANDMAKQLVLLHNCRGFSKKSAQQMIAWMNYQRYRWGIWRGVAPGTYVANKTGHLEGILNDVGLVYTKKGTYALAIMTAGFKNKSHARQLINTISRVVYEDYTGEKIIKRQLSRRPSVKSKRRSGRSGPASGRKSPTYRQR
ncbi:MAG: class A beta-lactamase-related serine hydrolase [Candidatus Margulisbacteria bacterium]|nr:class A beta-lactamase-related serine hydrolase [Candidatus Margulisiibacteriota bacterium]